MRRNSLSVTHGNYRVNKCAMSRYLSQGEALALIFFSLIIFFFFSFT